MKSKIKIEVSEQAKHRLVCRCVIHGDVTKEELQDFAHQTFSRSQLKANEALFVYMTEAEKGFFHLNPKTFSIEGVHRNAILLEKVDSTFIEVLRDRLVDIKLDPQLTKQAFKHYSCYLEQIRRGNSPEESLMYVVSTHHQESELIKQELKQVQSWFLTTYSDREMVKVELP